MAMVEYALLNEQEDIVDVYLLLRGLPKQIPSFPT